MSISFESGGPGYIIDLDEYPGVVIGITKGDLNGYVGSALWKGSQMIADHKSDTFVGLMVALDWKIRRHFLGE